MEEDRYTRITLRIPKELHARLDDEASKTSKSLNAEIVARLDNSFQVPPHADLAALLNQEIESLVDREQAITMRLDVLRSRADSMHVRRLLLKQSIDALDTLGNSDADLEKLEEIQKEADEVEAEIRALSKQVLEVSDARKQLIDDIVSRRELLKHARVDLMRRVAEGRAKK